MEKKTKKANLENKRTIFVQVGLIIALSTVLLAFESGQREKSIIDIGSVTQKEEIDETVIQTKQDKPLPPPPEKLNTILEIVPDHIDIDDDPIFDVEADQNTQLSDYVPTFEEEKEADDPEIFVVVEKMPSYPGGEEARLKFLSDNIEYPRMALESGIQGKVYVSFIIDPKGNIKDITILRDIGGGCGTEAVRVVSMMPKWNPGMQRNIPVYVRANMSIIFEIQSN